MIFYETVSVGNSVSSKRNFRNGCLKGKNLDHNSKVVSISCHGNWCSFMASSLIFHKVYSQRKLVHQVLGSNSNQRVQSPYPHKKELRVPIHTRKS